MPEKTPTLKSLITESESSDTPKEVLYHFTSSYRDTYEISDCEEEAINLLINFSVKREDVIDPLSPDEANDHLKECNYRLIKRFQDALRGKHTHNIKHPQSFLRGTVRCQLEKNFNDPYVHSGSVNLTKRFGYSQNAANTKASKGLQAEFYYQGKLTSMFEEIQQGSELSCMFMERLEQAVEGQKEAEGEENPVDALYESICDMEDVTFPDTATDPQVYAFSAENLLVSPVEHTGLLREIHLGLQDCKGWMKTPMLTGTGNEINTYGDLFSDGGSWLWVFRSVPPIEKKGEFRLLVNQLAAFGHLYCFRSVELFFLEMGRNYIDEETGELRRWTSFRQNKVLKRESSRIVRSVFKHYRKLHFYLRLGKRIPGWCQEIIDCQPAQNLLIIRQQLKKTSEINAVINELMPLVIEKVNESDSTDLPFTEHQQRIFKDAIRAYLQNPESLPSSE